MANINAYRKITIEAETKGVDAAASAIKGLDAAQKQANETTKVTATVTDVATKRALSVAEAYKRQTLAVVEGARAQDQLNRAIKLADQARAQQIISDTQHKQRIAELNQKYGEASAVTQRLTTAVQGAGKAFNMASQAAAAFGLALGVAAVVNYGKAIFNTTADLQEQADQILGAGGNVEALQALRGLFMQNGVSQEQGDKILQRLNRSLGEAAEGSQKAQDAFKKLGLGARDLAGQSADAALPLIAKKLLEIEDASKRAAIEAAIFGKTGQQLESALKALAEGSMQEIIKRGKELGIVIDAQMIKKADDAKDKMGLAFMKLSTALAPIVVNFVSGFTEVGKSIDDATKKLMEYLKYAGVAAAIFAGAKVGGVAGPGGALLGAVGAGGAAYQAAFGEENNRKQIAEYEALLNGGTLTGGKREIVEKQLASLYASLPKLQLYQGGYNLPGRAANDNGGGTWDSTAGQRAAEKAAEAAAKKLALSKQILPLDKEIADAADEQVKFALKQNEYKQEYIDQQEKLVADTDAYLADLEQEVKLAGMSREQREAELAVMEGMRVSGGAINEQQVRGLVQARQETERWRDVFDDMSRGVERFFEDLLATGKADIGDLWDYFKSSFFRAIAQMASQQFIQPLLGSVFGNSGLGGLFGGSSGGGGLTSLLGGGNPLGSVTNLLGMGGAGAFSFGTDIFSLGGTGGLSSLFGGGLPAGASTFGGQSAFWGANPLSGGSGGLLSGGFGTAFGGFGVGSLLGGMMGGNSLVSGGLGALGGLAGSALGILGAAGGPIGMIAGGLLGGALGNFGASNQGAISNFTNGGLGNTLFKAGGGQNGALATQATGSINATLKALQDAGIAVGLGNISGLSIGSDKSYVYDFAGGKQKLAGGEAGVQATVNAILDRILPGASATSPTAQAILAKNGGLNSGNLQQVLQDLGAAKQIMDAIDSLSVGNDNLSEVERAIKAINDQIDPLVQQAQALGIATDKLEQVRGDAIQQIRDAEAQARAQTDLAEAYSAVSDSVRNLIDEAQSAAQTAQNIANAWAGADQNLTQSYRAMLISDQSLTPTQRYQNSRTELDRLLTAGRTDPDSASQYASFASQFLQTSFDFNGSSTAYQGDRGYVTAGLESLAINARSQQSYAQRSADSLAASVTLLQGIIAAIQDQTETSTQEAADLRAEMESLRAEIKQNTLIQQFG